MSELEKFKDLSGMIAEVQGHHGGASATPIFLLQVTVDEHCCHSKVILIT
jgi:hypothetical protein